LQSFENQTEIIVLQVVEQLDNSWNYADYQPTKPPPGATLKKNLKVPARGLNP
jgi:hypothetical protein